MKNKLLLCSATAMLILSACTTVKDAFADTRTQDIASGYTGGIHEPLEATALYTAQITAGPADKTLVPGSVNVSTEQKNIAVPKADGRPGETVNIGTYELPAVTGIGDKDFQSYVNKTIQGDIISSVEEYKKTYEKQAVEYDKAKAEGKTDVAEGLKNALDNMSYISTILPLSENSEYFALANIVGAYTGGAHGYSVITPYNIDLANERFMSLDNLFSTPDYEPVLLSEINKIIETDPSIRERMYPGSDSVSDIDDDDWFLSGSDLVIFYPPYEIGPYSSGYIYFEIPLSNLSSILLPEYQDFETEVLNSPEELFGN